MEWTIDYLEREGVVFVKTAGESSWEDSKKLSREAVEFGRSRGSRRFLLDNRGLQSTLSVLRVDMLPDMLKQAGITVEDKMALLYEPSSPQKDMHIFFRNVSFIKSLQVQIFTSKTEAIDWLISDSVSKDTNRRTSAREISSAGI